MYYSNLSCTCKSGFFYCPPIRPSESTKTQVHYFDEFVPQKWKCLVCSSWKLCSRKQVHTGSGKTNNKQLENSVLKFLTFLINNIFNFIILSTYFESFSRIQCSKHDSNFCAIILQYKLLFFYIYAIVHSKILGGGYFRAGWHYLVVLCHFCRIYPGQYHGDIKCQGCGRESNLNLHWHNTCPGKSVFFCLIM